MISGIKIYQLVDLALQYIGVIAYGESIDPAIARTALLSLNNMRNSWAGNYINQIQYDKKVSIIGQTYHVSMGSYVPQDSVPVNGSRRIFVSIPKLFQNESINISLNEVDLDPITNQSIQPGYMVNEFADAINTADLGVIAVVAGTNKVLLTSNDDIGIYCTTSSAVPRGEYKYTGDFATRPASVAQIVTHMGSVNIPLPIKSMTDYRRIPLTTVSVIPTTAFLDTNYPIQNIYLFPGISSAYSISVQGHAFPREYERLTDNYVDSPELFKPLAMFLACDLARCFGQEPPQSMLANAHAALKHIKTENTINTLTTPYNDMFGNGSSFNIWSGM